LRITSTDPTVLAVWGEPSDVSSPRGNFRPSIEATDAPHSPPLPTDYTFFTPFPNPFRGILNFEFALPEESSVNLWIVRARWVGDANTDIVSLSGGAIDAPSTVAVRELLRNQVLEPGYQAIQWDAVDDRGNHVTPGFYRVYLRTGGYLLWHDVLLYRSLDELPPALRDFLSKL